MPPHLTVILVGSNPASQTYVRTKKRACESVGIKATIHEFPEHVSQKELIEQIEFLNEDTTVHGILLQLPLPSHLDSLTVMKTISPKKDVDGLHPFNLGCLVLGLKVGFIPCTPLGIVALLRYYEIGTAGKEVVIVGRSNIVGKPLASLLMQPPPFGNATVTIAHRGTADLAMLTRKADILVAATGVPNLITKEMVKEGAVVIDVGMNRLPDSSSPKGYRLVGDVDFENVQPKCSAITPVPGGIGPMTVAMLLENTLRAFEHP